MIDLHLHTTASDGRCTPGELVDRAAGAGIAVMAVTDHDTVASVRDVEAHAGRQGIEAIAGIEITAVDEGADVHVLGYFFEPEHPGLAAFLVEQRESRVARVEAMAGRLAELGLPIDVGPLVEEARRQSLRSIGRPHVARAMVAAGHVADTKEAFDLWIGRNGPAFVPRAGTPPETVIAIVQRAGGLASLAHPGRTTTDTRIVSLVQSGLDAIEAHHPDHDAAQVARYERLAGELQILVTGGSDFHGDPAHGVQPATASLPAAAWLRLSAARGRHASE